MKKFSLVAVLFVFAALASAQEANVDFPKDYRRWQHVKSMVIQKGHPLFEAFGGIHHIYANARAMQGYQKGKFPDGSVIVFDLLEAVPENNAITEGKRKVLGVMQKDSKRFAKTGGWGFEGFGGGDSKNRVVKDNAVKACFECHTSQKDKDYVFSTWRN